MSKVKKTTSIILLVIVLAIMTVALYLGIPSNAVKFASASTDTYINVSFDITKFSIPTNIYDTCSKVQNSFAGSGYEAFKIYTLELWDKDNGLIATKNIKLTYAYDGGDYPYVPLKSGAIAGWNDFDISAYYDNGVLKKYAVVSGSVPAEEYQVDNYIRFEYSLKNTTVSETSKLKLKVTDTFNNDVIWCGSGTATYTIENYTSLESEETTYTRAIFQSPFADEEYSNAYNNGYTTGYTEGFDTGEQQGYTNGYNEGKTVIDENTYNNGFDAGHTEGYNEGYTKGSYDVNLELSSVTSQTIGSTADFIMRFLDFEVAGISLWMILAAIGTIILIGIVIKIAL